MSAYADPPKPPALPKVKVSPGHVKQSGKKRWMRPRSYRREFMRTHPGLADQLLADERRKTRALVWTRRLTAFAMVALAVASWVLLMKWGHR